MSHGLHRKPQRVKKMQPSVEKNRGKESPGNRFLFSLCMTDASNGLFDIREASFTENSVLQGLPETLIAKQ